MKNLFVLLFVASLVTFSSCENASEQSAENEGDVNTEVPAENPAEVEEIEEVNEVEEVPSEEVPVETEEEADNTEAN